MEEGETRTPSGVTRAELFEQSRSSLLQKKVCLSSGLVVSLTAMRYMGAQHHRNNAQCVAVGRSCSLEGLHAWPLYDGSGPVQLVGAPLVGHAGLVLAQGVAGLSKPVLRPAAGVESV